MIMRFFRKSGFRPRLLFCLGMLLATACATQALPPRIDLAAVSAADAAEPEPPFQHWLDQAGIDFKVPTAGKAILVNIPAFELVAFFDGEPVLRSRVIVGTPWTQTPILETYTTAVRFRPTWRPTPSMVASGEYQDRVVGPGRNNPLGLAAIRLEPGLLVYLHDTNRRELFDEDARALSHGCVRVQRWDELIAWLIDVDLATVHDWADGSRTFDHETPPTPVTLDYFTVFPDDDGHLRRYPDVYSRDDADAGPVIESELPTETCAF